MNEDDQTRRQWWKRAHHFLKNDQPATALFHIQRIREAGRTSAAEDILFAMILSELGRYEEASSALRKALRQVRRSLDSRKLAVAFSAVGDHFKTQGRLHEAERWYRKLIQLFPGSTMGYVLTGAAVARQGRLDEAARLHGRAISLEGDRDEAYLNL